MNYTILETPKYFDKVIVLIEGKDTDDTYFTMEEVFSKDEFDNGASKALSQLLSDFYKGEDVILHELANDVFDLNSSVLSDCEEMTGYEVLYFDNNGVCYLIIMNF